MSDKAIETEDEIIDTDIENEVNELEEEEIETAEGEETNEQDDSIEIVVEGEEQPTSEPVRKSGFKKRIDKLNGKVEAANSEAEEAKRKAAMLEEENKLLRLKTQQEKPLAKPKYEDFDTDAEFDAATTKYEEERLNAIAEKKAKEILQQNQANNTQQTQDSDLREKLDSHYERAEKLKVNDYEETEDKAIDLLGNDLTKQIMANTDKSEILLYHLGKNPAKAESLAALIKTDPLKDRDWETIALSSVSS
jgi:hypothetical protein